MDLIPGEYDAMFNRFIFRLGDEELQFHAKRLPFRLFDMRGGFGALRADLLENRERQVKRRYL